MEVFHMANCVGLVHLNGKTRGYLVTLPSAAVISKVVENTWLDDAPAELLEGSIAGGLSNLL